MKIEHVSAEKPDGRIYVFLTGETILENLHDRRNRPKHRWKQKLLETGVIRLGQRVRWSQYAGCSCGCSPGFIVRGSVHDVFVTLTESETIDWCKTNEEAS